MNVRYYIDPETIGPHIHNHDLTENEVEAVLARLAKIGQGKMVPALQLARLTMDDI